LGKRKKVACADAQDMPPEGLHETERLHAWGGGGEEKTSYMRRRGKIFSNHRAIKGKQKK